MKDIAHLIEPDILEQIDNLSEVTVNKAQVLGLMHNRFDLAFKLYFLIGLDTGVHSAYREACYKQHIKAFDGSFVEPNNPEKMTYEQFKQVFEKMFFSIKEHGFDTGESLIPLAANGSILNGAHRTSIAIFLNKPVGTFETQIPAPAFNYQFFKKRGVPVAMLDTAAQTFAEFDDSCFLAAIWPAAKGHDEEIESILSRVVYKKNIRLNYNGAHNLLVEAYQDEPWLGPSEKNFPGIKNKLAACFPGFDDVRIYLFKADSLEQVEAKKKIVRDVFNIGNHAIHITNNHEETIKLGRLLFNSNGVHFLNHGYPRKLSESKIKSVIEQLSRRAIDKNDLVLDEKMIMEIYGFRQGGYKDWLEKTSSEENIELGADSTNEFYSEIQSDLADNPDNYFLYKGIKFISLKQVDLMKLARHNERDITDTKLIKSIVNDNILEEKWSLISSSLYYYKSMFIINSKQFVSMVLKKAGLLDVIKKMIRQTSSSN